VVTLYYYEELTLREIGEVLSVTESRVSQLHTKAILRLRARLRAAPGVHVHPPRRTADMPGDAGTGDRGWHQALNRLAATLTEER